MGRVGRRVAAVLAMAVLPLTAVAQGPDAPVSVDRWAPPVDSPWTRLEQGLALGGFAIDYERVAWPVPGSGERAGDSASPEAAEHAIALSLDASLPFASEGRSYAAGEYALSIAAGGPRPHFGIVSPDQIREPVPLRAAAMSSDRLTVSFPQVEDDRALLEVRWGPYVGSTWLVVDLASIVRERVEELLELAGPDDGRTIWDWAFYCYRKGIHLEAALGWVTRLAADAEIYWTVSLRARLLAANGRWSEAVGVGEHALRLVESRPDEPGVAEDAAHLRGLVASWRETAN